MKNTRHIWRPLPAGTAVWWPLQGTYCGAALAAGERAWTSLPMVQGTEIGCIRDESVPPDEVCPSCLEIALAEASVALLTESEWLLRNADFFEHTEADPGMSYMWDGTRWVPAR